MLYFVCFYFVVIINLFVCGIFLSGYLCGMRKYLAWMSKEEVQTMDKIG